MGFTWYFLGQSQHEYETLIQWVDIGGVYGMSFLIAFVNGLIYQWFATMDDETPRPRFATAHGTWRRSSPSSATAGRDSNTNRSCVGPDVALLQTNIAQDDKIARDEGNALRGSGVV